MAKLDGLFEVVLELAARIIFPRHNSHSIFEELSWSWLAVLILFAMVQYSIKGLAPPEAVAAQEPVALRVRKVYRSCRIATMTGILLSLFMFRFASHF